MKYEMHMWYGWLALKMQIQVGKIVEQKNTNKFKYKSNSKNASKEVQKKVVNIVKLNSIFWTNMSVGLWQRQNQWELRTCVPYERASAQKKNRKFTVIVFGVWIAAAAAVSASAAISA